MSDGNPVQLDSPIPKATGFFVGFMTLGIGILRSVQPVELTIRSIVAGAITWLAVKAFRKLLYQMSEEALNAEQ